jgi:hypothetical protein
MARKDLSRTVIEGGRSYYNSWERRASHAVARARQREWLDAVRVEHDLADERAVVPPRHVYKGFHDKLAPAERWLASNVGRPWAKVRSELFETFDTRTTAGRHIVFDHMLPWVEDDRGGRFRVDKHGLLRHGRPRVYRTRPPLGGGRAALTERGWWQAMPLLLTPCTRLARCTLDHDWTGAPRHYVRLRALRPLTDREVRWVGQLPRPQRRRLVVDARRITVVWP